MDVPTFDGHLDYSGHLSDPQVYFDWLHNMDRYFTRYLLFEMEKVRFAITKLTEREPIVDRCGKKMSTL